MARPALVAVTVREARRASIPGYIEEASALICGYLGHTFAGRDDEPVPDAARVVCARVVARAITSTHVDPNFDNHSRASAIGPFSHTDTHHVAPDVLGGGVWLTRQDKMALDSIGGA